MMPGPVGAVWAVDGLGSPRAHATPVDGRVRRVGIRRVAVVDQLMMLAAP